MKNQQKAFSLIELSIVLIVIGVLVGGIVVGNNIIKASRIQNVIAEFEKYRKAALDFKEKYYYWPGDMPNAYDFWATGAGCANSSAPAGCNGNGNGSMSLHTEDMRAWQFLKLAGYLSGTYAGTAYAVSPVLKADYNVPRSSFENPVGSYTTNTVINGYDFFNSTFSSTSKFAVSLIGILSSATTVEGAIRPTDAKALDRKIDDSLAASGNVAGSNSNHTVCLSAGEYDVSNNSSRLCIVNYRIEF